MRLDPLSLFDYATRAKQILPHNTWDFIAGGAKDSVTTRRNREALEAIAIRPQFLRDVTQRDLSTSVLGQNISFPVMISPAGGHGFAHPDGELATAKAAGDSGTVMGLSTSSTHSIEDVARVATGPLWFQLYHCGEDMTTMLVRRAENAGFAAVCLTVDTPLASPKECDLRNDFQRPPHVQLGNFLGASAQLGLEPGTDMANFWERPPTIPLTFSQLEWLRSLTSLPLVIKGIRTGEDARLCVENGVDGILASNHGGRQIDATLSSIETLEEIVSAVKGRAEVYLDSGIRRGTDVLKALALGARAVSIGRPLFWGLAVNGSDGVQGVLEILRQELDQAMGYCGITSVSDIDSSIVVVPDYMRATPPSYLIELKALARLKDDGIISHEEFQKKKQIIMEI
ncbi:alpha-hydroxy-acid oxidizing protein [SAR202 cluster bacterium AD-804-J14_MRT_500m]|nr:alpha-hydroxy-acid oxidizing protein [SAR202 cluster bacterium AD-804-J14_MRT_500m]